MKHIQAYKRTWHTLILLVFILGFFFCALEYRNFAIPNQWFVYFGIVFSCLLIVAVMQLKRYAALEKELLYEHVKNKEIIPLCSIEMMKQACVNHGFTLLDLGEVVYGIHPDHHIVLIIFEIADLNAFIRSHQTEITSFIKSHKMNGNIKYVYVMLKETLSQNDIDLCLFRNKGFKQLMFGYEQSTYTLHYLKRYPDTLRAICNHDEQWIYHEVLSMVQINTQDDSNIPTFSFKPYLMILTAIMAITFIGIIVIKLTK